MRIGEVGEKLRRSTVHVRSGRSGSGSGVIWDPSGAIVTNAHVVRSGDLSVELWDGRAAPARLLKRDNRRDLAILRIEAGSLESAQPGDSARIRVGQLVIAVGNPLGFIGALSTGVVHGVGPLDIAPSPRLGRLDFIQSTVRLAPGNSGGPLADSDGNVIGINTAIVYGGPGLAVPAAAVGRLLRADAPVELGVTVRPVRIPAQNGGIALLVLDIAADSPADYASLRPGDMLVGANGRRFRSVEDLRESLDQGSGSVLKLQFLRGDHSRNREVAVRLMQGVVV